MESQMNGNDELAAPLASTSAHPHRSKVPCRYFRSSKGCRAGDNCPFAHDQSKLGQVQPGASLSTSGPSDAHPEPVQHVDRNTQARQPRPRYKPPQVDPSRVVHKPVSGLQKDDPRQFQIGQLERRFLTTQKIEHGGSTLSFQLAPSDPDFPFDLTGLDCVIRVPNGYPENGRPSLAVSNPNMPRGYQINVERGFDNLAQISPHATLLSLLNTLDKQLEALLTGPKAETIKIVSNATNHRAQHLHEPPKTTEVPKPSRDIEPVRNAEPLFTPAQRRDAEGRRQAETVQLQARLGRLPLFSISSDGIAFTVPISPRKPGDLPVPLQAVRSIKLLVPLLYPLHPCRVELPGVNKETAMKTEVAFNIRAKDNRDMSLMAHVNYFAQHMHTMATEPEIDAHDPNQDSVVAGGLGLEEKETTGKHVSEPEDDRSHIKIIPRPPEWTMGSDQDIDSDDDWSDPYDSGDESGDAGPQDGEEDHHAPELTPGDHPAARSSLRLTGQLDALSSQGGDRLWHINSVRAGYLDLTGCTITDMLPSTFTPTCATCSTAVPAPGVVSVRGDANSIAICRECHGRLSFKIPETKFTLVSNTSLHPRHLLPLRRKAPKENLGVVAGQELPRRGRCRHYAKSYRWFRFSCCAKVYACDRCHDEKESHPNEHANRMICGFCSREQNYRPEDCGLCRATVVGKKGTGFWEGGKGTRDKSRMSRKDPRKYKRRAGRMVVTKGGIGGGGETAKKKS
ncbi:MAG: hypothetical protein Q9169_000705 [Polycauliona sp. 2 TL-2023]